EAAERGVRLELVAVDADGAGPDRLGHPQRPADVRRPHRGGQAVVGVVGEPDRLVLAAERDGPSSNARRAACTARSTSAGPATGNEATCSPVAGWTWLQVAWSAAAVQRPSMSMRPSPRPSSSRCGLMDATMPGSVC